MNAKIELDPGMMQSVVGYQEVPKENIMKPVNGQKRMHKGKKQVAG
jgi:hypothetical protein